MGSSSSVRVRVGRKEKKRTQGELAEVGSVAWGDEGETRDLAVRGDGEGEVFIEQFATGEESVVDALLGVSVRRYRQRV
jgi:hypothetical protein